MKFPHFAGGALVCAVAFAPLGCASDAAPTSNPTVEVPASTSPQPAQTNETKVQTAKIMVTDKGYEPASLNLKQGVPARVTFTRTTESACAEEIVLPDYKIKQKLPLNKPVVVNFTPEKTGTFAFTCGMKMMKGQVVVK